MAHPGYLAHLDECSLQPVVHIEISSKCNFHCYYCISSEERRPKSFMSLEMFKRILNQLPDVTVDPLRLHIDGEPTLHPEFDQIAELANAAGHYIALATNGSNLKASMLQYRMDLRIYVSTTPEELSMRSKMNFETYSYKLSEYVKKWSRSDSPQNIILMIYFDQDVTDAGNEPVYKKDFLRDFLDRCDIPPGQPRNQQSHLPFYFNKSDGRMLSITPQVLVRGALFPVSGPNDLKPSQRGFCDSVWKTLTILADGRIGYCCMDLMGATAYTTQNEIWEKPLKELWLNHQAIRRIRTDTARSKVKNKVCQKCLTAQDYCSNRENYMDWGKKFTPDCCDSETPGSIAGAT